MNEPKKHHYVPAFYLKVWANSDGLVPVFVRDSNGKVKREFSRPQDVGTKRNLYRASYLPDGQKARIETEYFAEEIDGPASVVHRKLVNTRKASTLSEQDRIIWSRFLVAQRFRVPEVIDDIKRHAAVVFRDEIRKMESGVYASHGYDPGSDFGNYVTSTYPNIVEENGLASIPGIIDDTRWHDVICKMNWRIFDLSEASVTVITSDRPIVFSSGMRDPKCYISLPIAPDLIFIASRREVVDSIEKNYSVNKLARAASEQCVRAAHRAVYGKGELAFVERRLR